MAQVLVRSLDEKIVEAVRRRAARNGRSLEHELRLIIGEAVRYDRQEALDVADRLRNTLAQQSSDSAELLREDRDR